jgi:hypothetical protein
MIRRTRSGTLNEIVSRNRYCFAVILTLAKVVEATIFTELLLVTGIA